MITKDNPLVTIIIASYNHQAYVESAIRSIVVQDYCPLEVIVIDDGSTDGSIQLLEKLEKRYKFRLIKKANGGIVSVMNRGIQEARGEFTLFHASDDESFPNRISGQMEVLKRYPKAAFVSGNLQFLTESGDTRGTLLPITNNIEELSFDDLMVGDAKVSSVTSFYRSDALRKLGALNENYRAEDPQIFLKLTHMGYTWLQWSGPPVIRYRLVFSSQSRTLMPLLIRQNMDLIREFSSHPLYPKAYRRVKTAFLVTLSGTDKKAAISLLKEGGVAYFSKGFIRAVLKLLLPKRVHHVFTKAGKAKRR